MDVLALAVAAALLVVGVAAAVVRHWSASAACIGVGGVLPLMAYADGFDAPVLLATLTLLAAPLAAPFVGWGCTPADPALRIALGAGALAGPVRTLLYDPFYDPSCTSSCDPNPLALAHISASANEALWLLGYVSAAALTWAALRGPSRAARAALATVAAGLTAAPAQAVALTTAAGIVALALTGLLVARAFESRARVADLARALENAADVETALRTAVGDPGITVTYPRERRARRTPPQASGPAPGQVTTVLTGPDGVVAEVHHDPGMSDTSALAAAVTGPARLALENGRLAARVRRQTEALAASRRRIVDDSDDARRHLERDLHDGAQQHVLALGLALRTALDGTEAPEVVDTVHRSLSATQAVLGELRELSHGFYPASLEQMGLRHALDGVVDRATAPVAVEALPDRRLPIEVERAIYLLVARLAATASRPLTVRVSTGDARVAVVVVGAALPSGVLIDVFAVLGGSLRPDDDAGNGPVVRGVLPTSLLAHSEAS